MMWGTFSFQRYLQMAHVAQTTTGLKLEHFLIVFFLELGALAKIRYCLSRYELLHFLVGFHHESSCSEGAFREETDREKSERDMRDCSSPFSRRAASFMYISLLTISGWLFTYCHLELCFGQFCRSLRGIYGK